jgi:carbonic anhydrase/acetyltransferase-like protein (isoleucine patch superfamily)
VALVLPFGGVTPTFGEGVFVAPNATVIGDVVLGDEASVWFGAVLRGDCGRIRIGKRTNVQDLVCIHMTTDVSHAEIGAEVTIGHGAILHGCRVEDGCLIGMGSILLDNCVVGEGSLVAAGALVPPGKVIPPRSLVVGSPGRARRMLKAEEAQMAITGCDHYVEAARRYLAATGGTTR